MKKLITLLIILAFLNKNFAQETFFQIDDFSENYTAIIILQDSLSFYSHKPSDASIIINERYTLNGVNGRREKFQVSDVELSMEGLENNVEPFVNLNTSGHRNGWIIYDDFNFDGNWDFAIQNKLRPKCKNPFYNIYLSDGKDFYYSNSFTKLATNQCEIFKIDRLEKTLRTKQYIKDDNGWGYINNKYIVKKGEPVLVESIEQRTNNDNEMVFFVTSKKIQNGKEIITNSIRNMLNAEGVVNFFSFETENGKKANIYFEYSYGINDDLSGYVGYILLDKKENVEFFYPILEKKKSDFTYNQITNELKFKNENTEYTIYDEGYNTGIRILSNGKTTLIKALNKSGSLSKINDFIIKNITK